MSIIFFLLFSIFLLSGAISVASRSSFVCRRRWLYLPNFSFFKFWFASTLVQVIGYTFGVINCWQEIVKVTKNIIFFIIIFYLSDNQSAHDFPWFFICVCTRNSHPQQNFVEKNSRSTDYRYYCEPEGRSLLFYLK